MPMRQSGRQLIGAGTAALVDGCRQHFFEIVAARSSSLSDVSVGSCVPSYAGPHGEAQLYERWRRALRVRQSGVELKPPNVAETSGHDPGRVERGERKRTAAEASK